MYSLVLLTVLSQPAPEPAPPSGTQPTQVLARIDAKGNLSIARATNVPSGGYGGCSGSRTPATPPGTTPVKVKVTTLVVTTAELPAKQVEAYTTDGRTIPAEKLAEMLEKDRPVLIVLDGKKVDPFLLQLYKEGTIVLVPPANTLNMVFAGPEYYGSPGYGSGYRSTEKEPEGPPPDRRPPPSDDQPKDKPKTS